MLQPLHTARDRSTARRLADARQMVLDQHYGTDGHEPRDEPLVLASLDYAVKDASALADGRVIDVHLGNVDPGLLCETVTILTSLTRADRVLAVAYAVRIEGGPVHEVQGRVGTGLWEFAVDLAARVL